MTVPMIISELQTLRESLGLTREELAHKLGLTANAVWRWETKKSKPSKLARRQISRLMRKVSNGKKD